MTDPICYPAPRSNSYLTQATTYSKLENLKRIKFIGFTNRENEILVAKKLIELIRGELPKTEISDGSCLDDVVFLQ
ncbi:hypothetical protein VNO78_18813 [Psophocarpus tetragonolobus]|uniref:Uncharacterized protein n=1 Tax=Psophocarpus tetragonolobus TaxID=3891 RepID=A0AAN9XGD0_PSOTE